MPDMTDLEDKLISELISELKDMDEKEARDMQEQIAYWKAFRLAYSQLKWSQRDHVQSIIDEEDN